MPYEDRTPGNTPEVVIEWTDITGDQELTRRWSLGWLLSTTYVSEGRTCLRTACTWDEGGWDDFDTYKLADVEYIHYIGKD